MMNDTFGSEYLALSELDNERWDYNIGFHPMLLDIVLSGLCLNLFVMILTGRRQSYVENSL